VIAEVDGQKMNPICLDDLRANQKASARFKDLAAVEQIEN
jgi:hypothetical protein